MPKSKIVVAGHKPGTTGRKKKRKSQMYLAQGDGIGEKKKLEKRNIFRADTKPTKCSQSASEEKERGNVSTGPGYGELKKPVRNKEAIERRITG